MTKAKAAIQHANTEIRSIRSHIGSHQPPGRKVPHQRKLRDISQSIAPVRTVQHYSPVMSHYDPLWLPQILFRKNRGKKWATGSVRSSLVEASFWKFSEEAVQEFQHAFQVDYSRLKRRCHGCSNLVFAHRLPSALIGYILLVSLDLQPQTPF